MNRQATTPGAIESQMRLTKIPFVIQLVILFFAADAIEKGIYLVTLSRTYGVWPMSQALFTNVYFPVILALLFDGLLAAMIALRTRAGRFWGIIYLVSLTGVSLALLVREPARWLEFGQLGRVREVATYAINLGLAGILLSATARKTLCR
jgi:hypothetical protein